MTLKIRWRKLLSERNMTIKDLSKETGISYRKLYHMIGEDADFVSLDTLGQVFRALDIPVASPFYIDNGSGEDQDDDHPKPRYRRFHKRPYRRRSD